MELELKFTENHTQDIGVTIKVKKILYHRRSRFQDILVFESETAGRVLVLDGCVMTTDVDEFIYHEMLAHVPLFSHPFPKDVLVIGGGDGGTLREVFKHKRVESATLFEIDGDVIEVAKEFLPSLSSSFSDPRCRIELGDGFEMLKGKNSSYDVIMVDSTDPVGPGEVLFTEEFYRRTERALKPEGILVAQCESPIYHADTIKKVLKTLEGIFPVVKLYTAPIPMYPSGMWCFVAASKRYDPSVPVVYEDLGFRYYNREVHRASFALPSFMKGFCS